MERTGSGLLESFSGLLFDWSRAWGLTSATSLADFLASLCFDPLSINVTM